MTAKQPQAHSSPIRPIAAACGAMFVAAIALAAIFAGCSNSECVWDYCCGDTDYLPIDDSEYPYAGLPRVVIETENLRKVKDRENEIPAKFQIWGESEPESGVMEMTIRGRGNTSWQAMPKKSYKIEFLEKQEILGMPEDKDWALVSNFADKTLMKNAIAHRLATKLRVRYSPRYRFVELYLNRQYLGVYMLIETIKVAKHRVNIPKTSDSYLAEATLNPQPTDRTVYSEAFHKDSLDMFFIVHHPKNASDESIKTFEQHINEFETYLKTKKPFERDDIDEWLDISECTKHYWVQEFTKNPDAKGYSSLFFTWVKGSVIRMGPEWDFDLAFGGHSNDTTNQSDLMYIKGGYWHSSIFTDNKAAESRVHYWRENKEKFSSTLYAVDSLYALLQGAARNNFKKWKILQSTEYLYHRHSYDSYEEAVEELKKWIKERYDWIDGEMSVSERAY